MQVALHREALAVALDHDALCIALLELLRQSLSTWLSLLQRGSYFWCCRAERAAPCIGQCSKRGVMTHVECLHLALDELSIVVEARDSQKPD